MAYSQLRWPLRLSIAAAVVTIVLKSTAAALTGSVGLFSDALEYARTRPTIRSYPKISQPLGQAIVKMLLDKGSPKDALDEVVRAANAALATS